MRLMAMTLLLIALSASAAPALPVAVAGVPMGLGQTRDYDRIFGQLAANGVTLFFPTFQYVEAPESRSLGFEADFVPPCQPDGPAFTAMRRHGIRLIVPASLLYPPVGPFPPLASDPLAALIACAGRGSVFGVLSFDEPVHAGVSIRATHDLYTRVKQVAPDLPVLMVHAPLLIEPGRGATQAERDSYLAKVAEQSRDADIVGFSTYPIPPIVAKMTTPFQNGEVADHLTAARDYVQWIGATLPDKGIMTVLQNFNYADQYSPEALAEIASPELLALVNAPTRRQLEEMAEAATGAGAELVVWYGAGFAKPANPQAWKDTLAVSAVLSGQR